MLVVSQGQIKALGADLNKPTVERIVAHLKERQPAGANAIPGDELRRRAGVFVADAMALGIEREFDLIRLSGMVFSLEPMLTIETLDAHLKDVLDDRRFTGEERVDIVTMRLAFPVPGVTAGEV